MIAQSVYRFATGWTVRGLNPDEGDIFHTHPGRPWGPNSFLYKGSGVSFPGEKGSARSVENPPAYTVEVKEREALYLYTLLPPPAWAYMAYSRVNFIPLPFTFMCNC